MSVLARVWVLYVRPYAQRAVTAQESRRAAPVLLRRAHAQEPVKPSRDPVLFVFP